MIQGKIIPKKYLNFRMITAFLSLTCVFGYGPKLLAAQGRTAAVPIWPTTIEALKAQGLEPFSAALRGKECCFVCGPLSLVVSAKFRIDQVRGDNVVLSGIFFDPGNSGGIQHEPKTTK